MRAGFVVGGAQLAVDQIEEGTEGAGGEGEQDEGPGDEAALASVVDHPEDGESAGDDEIGEDLGRAPIAEMGLEDAPDADVEDGFGGEGAKSEDDGEEGEQTLIHGLCLSMSHGEHRGNYLGGN